MGTYSSGILGPFAGKIGTVIGSTWKGIDYMRSKGKRKNKNASIKQLTQQLKFGLGISFLQSMSPLIKLGFSKAGNKQTPLNAALSDVLQFAIAGVYPAFSIAYPLVKISTGSLPNVVAPTATMEADSILNFNWVDNSGVSMVKASDKALLAAYCPELNQSVFTTGSANRSALADSLNLAAFTGKTVHVYIGFVSEDGQNIATSNYLGQFTVS